MTVGDSLTRKACSSYSHMWNWEWGGFSKSKVFLKTKTSLKIQSLIGPFPFGLRWTELILELDVHVLQFQTYLNYLSYIWTNFLFLRAQTFTGLDEFNYSTHRRLSSSAPHSSSWTPPPRPILNIHDRRGNSPRVTRA